jgi:hypothetical protein
MSNQPRHVRPELFRIAGTLVAAVIIVFTFVLDLGTAWLALALIVYGLSTALFGLAVVTNWRGVGESHRRGGTVGFTGWVQVAIGSAMIIAALIALAFG